MQSKVLLLCYGNPARGDDGLGPAFAEAFEKLSITGVTIDADYQLTVEDSVEISQNDVIIFIDAAKIGPEPYSFTQVEGRADLPWSSHSIEPQALVALAEAISGKKPKAWILGIRGYEFDMFSEKLSLGAVKNLDEAVAFLQKFIRDARWTKPPV